jgi:hypothetical protein
LWDVRINRQQNFKNVCSVFILGCHKLKQSLEQGIITDGLAQEIFKKIGHSGYLQTVGHREYLETESTGDIYTLFGTGDIYRLLGTENT